MRTQKIITIDTNTVRTDVELWHVFAARRDNVLNERLALLQAGMPEWDLLSVVPASADFPTGFYVTTWEYDPERYEDDSTDECEADVKSDSVLGPDVEIGGFIRVNGIRFRLTNFSQSVGSASIEFIDERHQLEQDEPEAFYRGPGLNYGVRGIRRGRFTDYSQLRYDGAKRRI